jgi:hypothetical protein
MICASFKRSKQEFSWSMWMSAKEEVCKTQIINMVAKRVVAILFHGQGETNEKHN